MNAEAKTKPSLVRTLWPLPPDGLALWVATLVAAPGPAMQEPTPGEAAETGFPTHVPPPMPAPQADAESHADRLPPSF